MKVRLEPTGRLEASAGQKLSRSNEHNKDESVPPDLS